MLAVCREEAAATTKGADGTGKTLKAMRSRLETVLVLMAMAEVAEVDEKEGLLRSVVVASARARRRATTTWYLCKVGSPEGRATNGKAAMMLVPEDVAVAVAVAVAEDVAVAVAEDVEERR
ncbi:hypothetical protein PRNP1_006042 [Phytophthora ramorum]